MNDISPELIAAAARRLYNEIPGMGQVPKSETAADPASLHVPGELPAHGPPTPAASAAVGQAFQPDPSPSEASSPAAAAPLPAAAATADDPLRAFVRNLRVSQWRNDRGQSGNDPSIAALERAFRKGASGPGKPPGVGGPGPFDVPAIRRDFPALDQQVHGRPLVWFDNAATTHKPQSVIDAVANFYAHDNSNIHRAAHALAARATDAYEQARQKVQAFLGASSAKEILFVRGATEGINLVAQTYGRKFLQSGDEIVLTTLEHHANIVPWQMIAREKGAVLRVVPVTDRGEIMLEDYQSLLGPRTRLVALSQASNTLGTVLPAAEMTQMAKRYNARVLIDGAQSVSHMPVNVQQLDCDFFVFSGHKIFAPTGIGVVYAKEELLEIMPPWQGGGNMIRNVTFEETTYSEASHEVRGRHAEHRRRGGAGRGAGLRGPSGTAEHRPARAGTAPLCHRATRPHRGSADHRHGPGKGGADLLRPQGP